LDLLLAGNYPKIAAKGFVKDFALGVLWKVDGIKPAEKAVREILDTGKCSVVRIHLMWRDDHAFNDSDIRETVKRAKEVAALMADYPSVKFLVSPWLEHRANEYLFRKVLNKVRKVLPPGTQLVNCGEGEYLNTLKERHHDLGACDIFSFDGEGFSASKCKQYKKAHKKCKYFFSWDWQFNCKTSGSDSTPRPERKHKPTAAYIKEVAKITKAA
jgi:hypothetical protein